MQITNNKLKIPIHWDLLGFTGLKNIPNIHPLFVHFPIALFPLTFVFYLIGILLKKPDFLTAGKISLYASTASGIGTAWSGLAAKNSIPFNEPIGRMLDTHEQIGLTLAGFCIGLIFWSLFHSQNRPKGALPFLAVLAFATYLAEQNGDIGSQMVYVQGAGVKPATEVILR